MERSVPETAASLALPRAVLLEDLLEGDRGTTLFAGQHDTRAEQRAQKVMEECDADRLLAWLESVPKEAEKVIV